MPEVRFEIYCCGTEAPLQCRLLVTYEYVVLLYRLQSRRFARVGTITAVVAACVVLQQ